MIFILDVPPSLPRIVADKLRLRQILFNLIGNAVKFTNSGSITIHAWLDPVSAKSAVFGFSVIDTGIGISAENQKKLFQLFVQVSPLRDANPTGTGLGLALCRRLVEHMNGTLSLTSEPGKGSNFTVELRDIPFTSEQPVEQEESPVRHTQIKQHCSILLVDDVPMNLKVMDALVRKLGHAAVSACGPEAALQILETQSFDFIFTDLWMPVMNGADLAVKIRQSGKHAKSKIIAITADVDSSANFDMSAFDAVMTKPASGKKILDILESV